MGRLAAVTMATGDAGRGMLSLTGPVLATYAKRVGAEFRVIRGDKVSPAYPMAAKLRLYDYLSEFDRVIWLDSDTVPAPDCPDLFALVPETHAAIYDEKPHIERFHAISLHETERADLCESQGVECPPVPERLFNSGVMVASRRHRDLFRPLLKPYKINHCVEQHWINLNAQRFNVSILSLQETYNWQWWPHKATFAQDRPMIAHFSGMGKSSGGPGDEAREKAIRERIDRLYPGLLPEVESECIHRGDVIRSKVASDCGLNPSRVWYRCERPNFPRHGLPVTTCSGCGVGPEQGCDRRRCDGFASGGE